MKTWRDAARPIIDRVLRETQGQSEKEIKAALRAAYPFGPRAYHPYKIWCDEIRLQRGLKKDKRRRKGDAIAVDSCAGQLDLFEQQGS